MNILDKIEKYLSESFTIFGGALPGPTVRNNVLPKGDKTLDTCRRCGVAIPKKDLKKYKNKMLCPDCIEKGK